ncbi:DUF6178 family protein [Bdellovibrio sp.]|uniref:DUF6178 family protein n=1 Tax=Bdellovibrio sp. TaxID=28201 RepID=UPI0039E21611
MAKSLALNSNSQGLLNQLITNNQLVQEIQNLDAGIVRKIVHRIGLEDAGELFMLITSEQLQEVMDQDVWFSAKSGVDEKIDTNRFVTWLEVLLEVGADFAADKISEMDEDLLISVLSELVLAIDDDELALMVQEAEDDKYSKNKYLEKALESVFNLDLAGYVIMSKVSIHWDVISNLLISLQKNHQDILDRILLRLQSFTLEQIDEHDGLYELLTESEKLEGDVSHKRLERREEEGYVASSSAAAFLKLIAQTPLEDLARSDEQDHISKMYFRNLKLGKVKKYKPLSSELLEILKAHGVRVEPPLKTKQLAGPQKKPGIHSYLSGLRDAHEELFQKKLSELNFLANVLITSRANGKKSLRPVEAMEMAIQICDEGLQVSRRLKADVPEIELIKLFKLGWKSRGH